MSKEQTTGNLQAGLEGSPGRPANTFASGIEAAARFHDEAAADRWSRVRNWALGSIERQAHTDAARHHETCAEAIRSMGVAYE